MPNTSVDLHIALTAFVNDISVEKDWSATDLTKFSELLFDALGQQGRRSADTAKHMAQAFEFLVRDNTHLAFHRLVLARHSSGVKGALSSVARAFGPSLLQLAEAQSPPGTGVLVALLLLRHHLPATGPMAQLPHWHRQGLVAFDAEVALLLYNTMFDRQNFAQNVAELRMALPGLDWIQQWHAHGIKKLQTLLHYWPADANATGICPLLELLENEGQEQEKDVARHDLVLTLRRIASNQQPSLAHDPAAPLHSHARRLRAALLHYALRPLGPHDRRPRVAICVSGQLRGYLPALASWRKHLLPSLDADFYVHTWKQAGRSGAEPFRRNLPFEGTEFERHYREQCMKMGYQQFVEQYPSLFNALLASSEVTPDQLREIYGTDHVVVEDDTAPEFAGWSNSRKMHYKINQVQTLVDGSNQDYEMILRFRPDKAMRMLLGTWGDIQNTVGNGNTLLADFAMGVHYGNLMVGDQVALGRPDKMRIYSNTYTNAVELEEQGLVSVNTFLRGHVSLARQCAQNGLRVGKFPALFGGLLGFAPLSSAEIQTHLAADTQGRSNATDQILMAAVARDLAAR